MAITIYGINDVVRVEGDVQEEYNRGEDDIVALLLEAPDGESFYVSFSFSSNAWRGVGSIRFMHGSSIPWRRASDVQWIDDNATAIINAPIGTTLARISPSLDPRQLW